MSKKISGVVLCLLLVAQVCWASPTGLNNIPTTDVTPDKILVLQEWVTVGDEARPVYMTGFKYGIFNKVEVGLDGRFESGTSDVVTLQGKLNFYKSDFGFSSLVGIEGIKLYEDTSEDIVPYIVLSQDIKFLRSNTGYGFQEDNLGFFCGIDKAVPAGNQELVLRSDLKQVNSGESWLTSAGFLLTLPFNLALESWISMPTESGKENSVTVKLNYMIGF